VANILILSLLRSITIICSELIFATRAWAIWERSRPILLLLIGLIVAFAALGITVAEISASDVFVTSRSPLVLDGVGLYQMTITAAKYPWAAPIPSLLILVYQSVVLALTLYKIIRYHKHIPKQSRSTLVDIFWIDGIIYYVFMFSEYLSSFLCVFLERITSIACSSWCSEHWIDAQILCKPLLGYCKLGGLTIWMHEVPRHTTLPRTVSVNASTSWLG